MPNVLPFAETSPDLSDFGAGRTTEASTKRTLATQAYILIREDILNGKYSPGAKLQPQELGAKYSIGAAPVREALSRLASEGMIAQNERRGFTVAGFSVVELDGILRTKRWLNEIGLRESIEHGSQEWEERILISLHRLARTDRFARTSEQEINRNPEWNLRHLEFHEALISACRSVWLLGFCRTLFFASDRYRVLARLTPQASDRAKEHEAIAQAAIARNGDEAVNLLNNHFSRTADLVRDSITPS
ncbi:GntR family transcriptional regulator [Hoeflea sp. CAU 1731]